MTAPLHRLLASSLFVVLTLARLATGQQRTAGLSDDEWQLMYMDTAKVGFVHILQEPIERDGRPLAQTTSDSSLTINRLGTTISLIQSQVAVEDLTGQIVEISSEANTSAAKSQTRAIVTGGRAEVTRRIAGLPQVQTIDWSRDWIGPQESDRQLRAFVAAGTKEFKLATWTPDSSATVLTYQVIGKEAVDVPGLGTRDLLHLRNTIDVQEGVITDTYLEPDGKTLMTSTKTMGLRFITVRSTKAACVAAFANPDTPEVFEKISPRTNVRLPAPYRSDEIVLHITATDAEVPLPALADERQTIVSQAAADDLVLRVRKVVPSQPFALPLAGFTDYEKECLAPNLQIESDDPRLVALAKSAIGEETDAWKAACKLEHFAFKYISNKGMSSLLETAVKVMETKSGDCTEHGVFLAALCRAVGIPARVAVGFLYYKGIWGGHMWTEVSLGGHWYALDAVLGHGGVDAGHLRLAADSLKSSEIARVFNAVGLGMTMKLDLVSYRHGDREVAVGADATIDEIDGNRYRHLLFDVSLTSPDGWKIVPTRAVTMGDNKLVELRRPDGSGGITVEVVDTTYDTTLKDTKGMLEAGGMTRLKPTDRTIDNCPATLFRGKAGKAEVLAVAVLRDQMVVFVTMKITDATDETTFEAVLSSLVFEE